MQSIASELDEIIAAFDDHRGEAALKDTFWLRNGVTVLEGLHELKDRIASLDGQLRLRESFMARLPFCPDHRDKVAGKPCRECEIERLQSRIVRAAGYVMPGLEQRSFEIVAAELPGACARLVRSEQAYRNQVEKQST